MNKAIEEKIITAFFEKSRAERAKYALANKNKRYDFIWKFSNSGIFKESCMEKILQPIASFKTVLEILKARKAPDGCYVMYPDKTIDGMTLPLTEALQKVVGLGPALISCEHGKLAYLECEQSIGAPERYLLIAK